MYVYLLMLFRCYALTCIEVKTFLKQRKEKKINPSPNF